MGIECIAMSSMTSNIHTNGYVVDVVNYASHLKKIVATLPHKHIQSPLSAMFPRIVNREWLNSGFYLTSSHTKVDMPLGKKGLVFGFVPRRLSAPQSDGTTANPFRRRDDDDDDI